MMRALYLGMAALCCLALGGGAQAAESTDMTKHQVEMPAANWLLVQTAASMTSDGKTLTLKGVAPQTLMFTDRPERAVADATTEGFIKHWNSGGKESFEKDPPNATLSTLIDGKPQLTVVELTNPVLKDNDLTYDIKVLGGEVPKSAEAPSLFIDWWYGPGWGPGYRWGPPPPFAGGGCWRGYWGHLHCRVVF
jgi:hypothetical protein